MNRFAIVAGVAVLGISLSVAGQVRADHDHDHGHKLRPAESYRFGAYSHVDQLANRVMRDANAVCWEMYRNYSYEPGYRQAYREAYEMLKTAEYIHELVHHGGRRSRVAHEIEELDKLFHDIEQGTRSWQRPRYRDYHGGGLDEKMEILEANLHHLMDDAGYKPNNTLAPRPEAAPNSQSAPPSENSYRNNDRNNGRPDDNLSPRQVNRQRYSANNR